MANWYYTEKGEQKGPVSEGELSELIRQGRIQQSDGVWKIGMNRWRRVKDVPTFAFVAGSGADQNAEVADSGRSRSPREAIFKAES